MSCCEETGVDYMHENVYDGRGCLFGSAAELYSNAQFIGSDAGFLYVYLPEASDAALIEKNESIDGVLSNVNVYEKTLNEGTNRIPIGYADDSTTYMLWDSLGGICSMAGIFVH